MIIELNGDNFMLQGVIIFKPPIIDDDLGHYMCAVRINNNWELYDDMDSQPRLKKKRDKVCIHAVFYINGKKNETTN